MGVLSKEELDIIESWREDGVLADVVDCHFDQTKGVVLLGCGDGDYSQDIIDYKRKMQRFHRSGCMPRIHLLTCNGGAIRLAENSPANVSTPEFDKYLIQEVIESLALKDISCLALYAHAPCGKARAHGINIVETMSLLISAKKRAKKIIADHSVAAFFHVGYPDGRKKTYFVHREQWEEWYAKYQTREI